MRILVAGWHGQVALALSEAAARRDDVVAYAVGRPALDLTDRPSIGRTLFGMAPDVIINTAAYTDVEGAEREPDLAFRRNTEGAAALSRQAARIGIPIVHLSTVYVFDGEKSSAYRETDPPNPINAYGRSKRDGEAAVSDANPKHIILRTGWIYSPFGHNFVSTIVKNYGHEDEFRIDDRQRGSPTYAPHLANAILNIVSSTLEPQADCSWGTYHVADQGTASWFDIANEVFRTYDPVPVITAVKSDAAASGAPRPANATLDCTKLEGGFGIRLPAWQDAVADCVGRLNKVAR